MSKTPRVHIRQWLTAAAIALSSSVLLAAQITGCASGEETTDDSSNDTTAVVVGTGGAGGTGTGVGAVNLPCGVDCSAIATPDCQVAQCNQTTQQCEVVNDEDGVACDDGLFCTISDSCQMGMCVGGPQNDCGMTPPQCTEVTCDETAQMCSTAPSMNGAPCQDPDLCIKGSMCTNGLCLGGMLDTCFFEPVPNECHISVCDSADGICKPEIGNEAGPCTDLNDLCTVDKTCAMGVCVGGNPKDCSALTMGCFDGVCDTANGNCVQQAIMPGGMCSEATDQCNQGICDMNGMCNPTPANEGMACDDNSFCTGGDICQSGVCNGQTTITTCINGDFCCPNNCNINNDSDCNPTQVIRDAINRGWWRSTGNHTSSNNNTLTGQTSLGQYNSYYSFDLSGITGTVITAELHLEVEAYSSADSSETLSIWDVSTPAATLEATGNDVNIFNDLQTGNSYGTFTVLSSEVTVVKMTPLNAQAVTDINAALGGDFSVGVHVDSLMGPSTQWVRFSSGSEMRTHQLVLGVL